MKSYILLEDVEFYSNHGVFEQENKVGNVFIINLKIGFDITQASESDDVSDTIHYGEVYDTICQEMQKPSKLIEHVAKRIVSSLRTRFPLIENIELKLSKRNPPIGGQAKYASILLID